MSVTGGSGEAGGTAPSAPAMAAPAVASTSIVVAQAATPGVEQPAARPIGRIETIEGNVQNVSIAARLVAGAIVRQGDVVETGPDGRLMIRFDDGTTMASGPGSRVVLNQHVYDPAGKSSFVMSVVKGTFLFVTGLIAGTDPNAVEVLTPAGTIGIRGTAFACTVDGATQCVLLEDPSGHVGRIEFFNPAGRTTIAELNESVSAASALSAPTTARLSASEVRSLIQGGLERQAQLEPTAGPDGDGGQTGGGAAFAALDGHDLGGGLGVLGALGPQRPTGHADDRPDSPTSPATQPLEPPRIILASANDVSAVDIAVTLGSRDLGTNIVLPSLAEGTDVFSGTAFAEFGQAIFGDSAGLTLQAVTPFIDLQVAAVGGAFRSALASYVVEDDGRIVDAALVSADVSTTEPGISSFRLDHGGQGFVEGQNLGLILLADGATQNPILQGDLTGLTLELRESTPGGLFRGVADAGDEGLLLVARVGGRETVLAGDAWYTTARLDGLPLAGGVVPTRGLNMDGGAPVLGPDGLPINQHYLQGQVGADTLRIAFEDQALGIGDRDYEDLVLDLTFPPLASLAASSGRFNYGVVLTSRTGELDGLEVRLANPATGDRLILGESLALGSDGEVVAGGQPTGVRLSLDQDAHLVFAADRPVSTAVMEGIVNGLALETGNVGGVRQIAITASEPGGDEASLALRFLVPDSSLVGSAAADHLKGSGGSDLLLGLAGDDLLEGGKGDDILAGGPGGDRLVGGRGADIFKLGVATGLDDPGVDQLAQADVLTDFHARQGDLIDLSALVSSLGLDPTDPAAFLRFVANSAADMVEIQLDPTASGSWTTALVVEGTDNVTEVAARTLITG